MEQLQLEVRCVQEKLRMEGLVVFSYCIEYPYCEGAARFCAFWEDFCAQLRERVRTFGQELGAQRLEAHLAAGGKRSRFACPRFHCRCEVRQEADLACVILRVRLTQAKETLWEHTEGRLWDVFCGICRRKKGNCR